MDINAYDGLGDAGSEEETSQAQPVTNDVKNGMTDGGLSDNIVNREFTKEDVMSTANAASGSWETAPLNYTKRAYGLYNRSDIDIFNRRYRFGLFMPYDALSTTREFLFFTKPDLNIISVVEENDPNGYTGTIGQLVPGLAGDSYFEELYMKYLDVIKELEYSYDNSNMDPFNNLLANMCISNLSVPGLDAETIDTPTNSYGTGYSYRGSSEASNDNFDFSLEFRDTKYLPVYHFFKAYEEYETLKHHGVIAPQRKYIENKVLHDQFAIYKFLVDEDMETIVYYAKFYGVYPKSLPRDVFSSASFDSGLSYSIDFRAAFFDDMNPLILNDFNALSASMYNNSTFMQVDVYNDVLDRMDNRPVRAAYVVPVTSEVAPGQRLYKLKWKGSDTY